MSYAIVSMSAVMPGVRDRTGNRVNEGCDVPAMRGRKDADPAWMIQQLGEALESLSETPCSFWACEGPTRPRYMTTCNKCWTMRQIAGVKRTLERSLGVPPE
jgi:hypothetical protein